MVLDASAVLAALQDESGDEVARSAMTDGGVISAANLAEVLSKAADIGLDPGSELSALQQLGVQVVDVTGDDAVAAARLRAGDAADGRPTLSLGNRLCLALASRLDAPVLTADRAWSILDLDLDLDIDVHQLR